MTLKYSCKAQTVNCALYSVLLEVLNFYHVHSILEAIVYKCLLSILMCACDNGFIAVCGLFKKR